MNTYIHTYIHKQSHALGVTENESLNDCCGGSAQAKAMEAARAEAEAALNAMMSTSAEVTTVELGGCLAVDVM